MTSGNTLTPGQATGRKFVPKRCGGRFFDETKNDSSSSESDDDVSKPSGGVKLNVSPYRPPHVRLAKSQDSISKGTVSKPAVSKVTVSKGAVDHSVANNGNVITPEATDGDSPLAVKMGRLTFQRGNPAGRDIFEPAMSYATLSSSSDDRMEPTVTDTHPPAVMGTETSSVEPDEANEPLSPRTINAIIADAMAANHTEILQAQADVVAEPQNAVAVRPQQSNRHLVGDQDAQSVFSHTSCLFIANLPQQKTDEALEAEITRQFAGYGTVYVKIKRDERDMPFGFLQYTNDQEAADAVQLGTGTHIFGRGCRVEMAKGNRTFLVFRHDRTFITVDEAMPIVAPYGQVSRIETLREDFAQILDLPFAVFVEYAQFDCERDITYRYRGDRTYRVMAFDETKVYIDSPHHNADERFLSQYARQRVSVFVGDLPYDVNEEDLRAVFGESGDVTNVEIVQKTHKPNASFAYVEFARPDMVEMAIRQWDGAHVFNTVIRVEKRTSKDRQARRVNSALVRQFATTPGSNARNGGAQSGNRRTPRRVVTAAPRNTPFVNAQADMTYAPPNNMAAVNMAAHPSVPYQTPAHDALRTPPIIVSSADRVVSSSTATRARNGDVPATLGAGLAPPAHHLSALAPPFGPTGFYPPAPAPFPAFGGFPGAYGGFNGPQYPAYGNYGPAQQQGYFQNQMGQYQDPASGLIYPFPPLSAAPPMVDQTPAYGQRSVSAMPYVPAAEHLHRNSSTSLKSKKSVSFADPVVQASPESEKDTQDNEVFSEKNGAA